MADTLKQFGEDTDINYTELMDGQQIVSTTGSQKAVIKDISIDNPQGRNIDVSFTSKNGTKVATTKNKIDTLTGNLILDNSQSLYLSSTDTCAITDFRARGWGEGNNRSENKVYKWGNPGTQFNPGWTWDGVFSTPNVNTSTGNLDALHIGINLQNPSNGFEANGYWYWHHMRDSGTYNTATMYRTDAVEGTTGAGSTVTAYGNGDHYVLAYDGSRYIYTMGQSGTTIRKYDTSTLGTSDTYTSITVLQPDSDSAAQTVSFGRYNCGFYFRDGYLLVNANGYNDNSTAPSANFTARIIDVATGKSRLIYDIGNNAASYFSSVSRDKLRRPLGIARDSSGVYWAFMGHTRYYNSNSNENRVWGCALGTNPATDFLANGKNYGATFSYKLHDFSTDNNMKTRIRQNMIQCGEAFGNSCGAIMYTPGLDKYLYTYVKEYSTQSNTNTNGIESGWHRIIFDFDSATAGADKFMSMSSSTTPSEVWSFTGWVDADTAKSSFGTVKARTAGILVT